MNAEFTVTGLSEAEEAARKMLEHIEEIKKIQRDATWNSIRVRLDLTEEEAASGS